MIRTFSNDTHKEFFPSINERASQRQEKLQERGGYFRKPFVIKKQPNFPRFEHTSNQGSLDIHGCLYASWVQEELSRRGLQTAEGNVKADENGELCFEKEKTEIRSGDVQEENTNRNCQDGRDGVATILTSLKAFSRQRDLHGGHRLHADIIKMGLHEMSVVGNAVVNMYAKCGELDKAQEAFDQLSAQNVVSWTALISGYNQYGCVEEAWDCFDRMQQEGISPNLVTFLCVLKACCTVGAAKKGLLLHAQIVKEVCVDENIEMGTALVDMYAKCGLLREAKDVFDELYDRDVVSWTTLITGYVQHGQGDEALHFFNKMQDEGYLPNEITFTCALKACSGMQAIHKGQQLHAQIVNEHLLESNVVAANALIDMYTKCGVLTKAQEVFDKLIVRNEISWTALISGYAQHGDGEKAINCFKLMQLQGLLPNEITYVCILTACSSIGALQKGQELHAKIVKEDRMKDNIVVANALIDMYARCGSFERACAVAEQLQCRDVVSWNALIAAYVQNGLDDEALSFLELMQRDACCPDAVTFVCLLKACGSLGAANKGQVLHSKIDSEGLFENNNTVMVSLLDMYARCGLILEAQIIFDKLSVRDTVSWNALMAGYARLGNDELVFKMLNCMIGEGIKPDSITFTIVLNTCCHRGLLDKGQNHFTNMHAVYGIIPTLDHHACIVDLVARTGHLDEVVAIFQDMSFLPDISIWNILFCASQRWEVPILDEWNLKLVEFSPNRCD